MTKDTDHTSTETDYEYDPAGRLKSLTYNPGGADRVTAYEYNETVGVTLATYSNGYTSHYDYDAIGRVTQHVLKDDDGPPNTLEQYDYDYSPGGLPSNTYGYERAETTTGDTYLIAFDRLNRIKQEKMTDSGSNLRYQFDHTYDSAGNRTALEISGNLQNPRNFGYTYSAMGHLTAISENTNLNNYAAAVTNDANGNITQVTETWNGQFPLVSTLQYDYENRLTQHAVGMLGIAVKHAYDGLGRLVRTDRTTSGPTTTVFEHVRDGLKLVGNIDATNTNTAPTWTNKPGALRPVESQQVVTNSATQYINVPDEISPARRTYNPSTSAAGDTEAIAAKGRLVLVNGATPAVMSSLSMNPSELFSQRNMTYNENSIALPSDRGALEVSGANLMYEGARVKSWMLGRDVNPAGRGDGAYYAQGAFSIGSVRPSPTTTPVGGWGNSINNDVNFGLVEKEEDEVQGRRIYFTGTAIIIATPSTGDCPNCFSAIKTPKEGCYLYLWKYAAPGECRTQFGCDCGWPKGSAPSGGQTSDGKDVPPCIGGGMNIGGTPIFTPPGGNSCPGCDIPIGPPQARMPGPGIPGAPNAGSMPSNSIGANANYLDFSLNLHNIYGYGIVSLDSPAISIFHTAALYGATGNWSSWSQRYNRCMARCMSYWPRIPFNTQSPAIQGWYDFIMYLTGVALAMLAFGFAGGFAGELAAAVDLQVKQILLNCGIAIHGSSFIKDGNVIGLILGAIGVVSAVLAPIDVSAFVWNSIDWARHRISRAGCAVYCATRASMGKQ